METQRKPIELKAEFRGNKRSTTFAGRNEGAERNCLLMKKMMTKIFM